MALSGSLNFLSASEIVSYYRLSPLSSAGRIFGKEASVVANEVASGQVRANSTIPVDFVGLNTIVYEPLDVTTNTASPDGRTLSGSIINKTVHGLVLNAGIDHFVAPGEGAPLFNSLMLNRNGPYQHPSWKQIRGGHHPVARRLRLHNTMSVDMSFSDAKKREELRQRYRTFEDNLTFKQFAEWERTENSVLKLYDQTGIGSNPNVLSGSTLYLQPKLTRFYEPSVVIKHKPMIYDIVYSPNYSAGVNSERARVRSSLKNNMVFFENHYLNKNLKINEQNRNSQYYEIIAAAKDISASDFVFSKMIFPKSVNVFRPFKLEKLNYEESSGLEPGNGYDREINRTFWRSSQPSFDLASTDISADGSNRTRTPEVAINSQGFIQSMKISSSFGVYSDELPCAESQCLLEGFRTIIQSPVLEPQEWNHTHYFIENGIIPHSAADTLTGSLGSDHLPLAAPSSSFINQETYNPYPVALLSMWPLDARQDIFKGNTSRTGFVVAFNHSAYLRSPIGGKGAQIGLTPHRMKRWNENINPEGDFESLLIPAYTAPLTGHVAGSSGDPHDMDIKKNATASYGQFANIVTGTAGELVYSTKPTLFLHKQESLDELIGYRSQTASLQYNRHTFPYNTPFYATNVIRGREPFFNSYSDFAENLKYIAREYSYLPEFRLSEHLDFYYKTFFDISYGIATESPDYDLYKTETVPSSLVSGQPAYLKESSGYVIKRRINPPTGLGKSLALGTKLDFLTIDGAEPSASADISHFGTTPASTTKYNFDTLNLKAEEGGEFSSVPDFHIDQLPQSVEFFNKFSNTDELEDIVDLFEFFQNGKDTIPKRIQFTATCIKKLLPYKNFYPVTKTVDIGNKFKNYIENNINLSPFTSSGIATDNRFPGALQSFLEPWMSPGILYNSIKSGVGVTYPIFESRPIYFAPLPFFSGTLSSVDNFTSFVNPPPGAAAKKNTSTMFTKYVSSSFNYGGFQMVGASRCIPAILNSRINQKLPFSALFEPEPYFHIYSQGTASPRKSIYLTTDFLDLDINAQTLPHPSAENGPTGSKNLGPYQANHHPGALFTNTGPRGQLLHSPYDSQPGSVHRSLFMYRSSINNFLCETMNFFLKEHHPGVALPVAVSKPIKKLNLETGKRYFMELSIYMGEKQVMVEGPRDAGIGGGSSIDNTFANNNRNASMRGYLYGPPVEAVEMSGSATTVDFSTGFNSRTNETGTVVQPFIRSWRATNNATFGSGEADYESYFAANLQDPAYAPYTPPYFYGKSSYIASIAPGDGPIPDSISVDTLGGNVRLDSFYYEQYVTGSTTEALCRYVPGLTSQMMAQNSRMKVDEVIAFNLNAYYELSKEGVDPPAQGAPVIYHIEPTWVCPVLDFSSSFSAVKETYVSNKLEKESLVHLTNSFHNTTTGKGLWGGYGTDPYDVMTKQRLISNTSENTKGLFFAIKYPFQGESAKQETSFSLTTKIGKPGYDGYYSKALGEILEGQTAQHQSASLGEELGFLSSRTDSQTFKIGEMADSKEISEAIVLIPYLEKPIVHVATGLAGGSSKELFETREIIPGRHFLPIHNDLFENILSIKLVEEKYNKLIKYNSMSREEFVEDLKMYHGFSDLTSYEAARTTDVYKLVDMLMGTDVLSEARSGYQMPPELDFVNFNVNPFQMVVIPVDATLSKQELMDIYQGIMPDQSIRAEKTSAFTSFDLYGQNKQYSRFEWMPAIRAKAGASVTVPTSLHDCYLPANFLAPYFLYAAQTHATYSKVIDFEKSVNIDWLKSSKDFYKNLKFMTFKIKQKALKNYTDYHRKQIENSVKLETIKQAENLDNLDQVTSKQILKNRQPKRVGDVFGSNWPYDDFSLIEAVKMDIKFKVQT